MSPTFDAFLRSWPIGAVAGGVTASLAAQSMRSGGDGCVGAIRSVGTSGDSLHFLAGLAAFYLALASPIEPFASLLLSVHMLQHLLLMMLAPPLVWLGLAAVCRSCADCRSRCGRIGLRRSSVRRQFAAPLPR